MVQCPVFGCSNREGDLQVMDRGVTFHRFPNRPNPRDKERRAKWIKAVRRDDWEVSKRSRLCSEHFTPEDFEVGREGRRELKITAVPSVFKAYPERLQKDLEKKSERKAPTERGPPPPPKKRKVDAEPVVEESNFAEPSTAPEPSTSLSFETKVAEMQNKINSTLNVQNIHSYAHPSSQDDLKAKYEMLNELFVTNMEKNAKERAKLQKEIRILKGKVESMAELIDDLKVKKILDDESTKEIADKYLKDDKNALIQKLMRKGIKTAKYDMDVLEFAQTLRFYSPKAYEYMRTYLALPTTATLNNHLRSFQCMPGIIQEAVDALERARDDPETGHLYKHTSMVVDEMSIKEYVQLIRNLNGGTVFGTVDYGNSLNLGEMDDLDKAANSVLVVMVVGYDGHWKLPIAYFFTRGLKAGVQAGIMRESLKTTFQVRVKVLNVTLDGTEHNPNACEKLGAKFFVNELGEMITFFEHPHESAGYNVHMYLDPCHMIKLARNTLFEYKEMVWPGRGTIRCAYIEGLHDLQQEHDLRAGNKLGKQHINFKSKIMKVSLAAQIFSKSVADALR